MDVLLRPPLASGLGVTLKSSLSPRANTVVAYPSLPSTSNPASSGSKSGQQQLLYVAQYGGLTTERRELAIESYPVFASLQKISQEAASTASYRPTSLSDPLPPGQVQYYNRICRLYRDAIVKQLETIESDTSISSQSKIEELEHHASLHGILSLTEILYLPMDGRGEGVVGEEILDWVNTIDRAPSTEEGIELADLSRPWEHPNFWPYIFKSVLRGHLLSVCALLSLVSSYGSPMLSEVTALLIQLMSTFPRSTQHQLEASFFTALRRWRNAVKQAFSDAEELFAEAEEESGGDDENEEERMEWLASFRCLFEILLGTQSRILETSEDWREALGAWAIWVNAGAKRNDLPDTLLLILKHHPVDSTLTSEVAQSALITGDTTRALQQCSLLSTYLVAHLSDLLEKINVVESDGSYERNLRDHFVLEYADLLQADPELWRLTIDYLVTCGDEGRMRAKNVIRSVAFIGSGVDRLGDESMDQAAEEFDNSFSSSMEVVQDILRVCAQQGMEAELKSISRVWAQELISRKKYGAAVPFYVRANDMKGVARIAEYILEEYVTCGQEAFIAHVDSIPTSLLRPNHADDHLDLDSDGMSDGMDEKNVKTTATLYNTRLRFLARYRDFFALYAKGDRRQAAALLVLLLTSNLAPKRWFGVLLLDMIPLLDTDQILVTMTETYELLRCLEEITAPIVSSKVDNYGYLDALARIVSPPSLEITKQEKTRKALKQLDVVRGALARHLGRCCCLPL